VIPLGTAMAVGVICVLLEGFFSGSEIALVSADRTRLRQRAADGDRGARRVERLLEKPQVFLATTLMGTNLATVSFSVAVALALIGHEGDYAELLAIAMVTPMTLIFGEVVPKTLFQQHADKIAPKIVYPLTWASYLLRPGVWIMSGFAGGMTRLTKTDRKRAFITRDELALLIESEASSESEITDEEREMIANVFELSEATAEEVMVPLSEVTALPEDTTVGDAALEVADKQHSRMPVYRSRVDDIVGILHVFDLLQAGPQAKSTTIEQVARPAVYVPENKPAGELLVELQRNGNHMAIVVDEYGGATGIVTVEDILEEIVGEIDDEYDTRPSPIRQERPGVWRLEAKTSVERVNSEISAELPESDEYETVAGLILDRLKRIPEPGETIVLGNVTIRVVAASDRAVEEVQLSRRRK
jgi:CBS domain containing-hemolysin-like protein